MTLITNHEGLATSSVIWDTVIQLIKSANNFLNVRKADREDVHLGNIEGMDSRFTAQSDLVVHPNLL